LLQNLKQFIDSLKLPHAIFGIAVSGGIDSVVLCELCAQAGIQFFLVHCNFKLRGEESERDEQFVRRLAEKYGVAIIVKEFDTEKFASENKYSIQVSARELRYRWFMQLHQEDRNIYILLAHHANDDIETVLMNFFRGTGLEGLTGMSSFISYNFCLRPLLNSTRQEIAAFAANHKLDWVEDSSNQSNKYTRNFFRNEVIPLLKKVYPTVEENLLDNIRRFKSISALYKLGTEKLKKEIVEINASGIVIPIHKLKFYQHTSLMYEIIKDYGFTEKQVEEVWKLMGSESGRYVENESYQVIKHRKNLVITAKNNVAKTVTVIERETKNLSLAGVEFNIRYYSIDKLKLDKREIIAQVDARLISFPLLVRKWVTGDYFYPLGLRKKKKLSRFFIDQKLSRAEKENIWVVESDKRIIWVAGLRIDDRFKITSSTKEVLELSISNP
jgi:tRNA(Ile)-lysidine synthase